MIVDGLRNVEAIIGPYGYGGFDAKQLVNNANIFLKLKSRENCD